MRAQVVSIFFCMCLLYGASALYAQPPAIKLVTGGVGQSASLVFEGNQFEFQAHVDHLMLYRNDVKTGFVSLQLPDFFLTGRLGTPALPQKSILFEAGLEEVVTLHILHMDSVVLDLQQFGITEKITPRRASVQKGVPLPDIQADSMVYNSDVWIGGPTIAVEYEGIMRGLSMSSLHFSPVKYNPVRNILKVYFNVKCTIEPSGSANPSHVSSEAFTGLHSRVVRKRIRASKKAIYAEEPMTLVILSDTLFRETLQPFLQWKTLKGFNVLEVYGNDLDGGRSADSIKSTLKKLYTEPADGAAPPSYLLIVGDVQHIPLSQSGGQITDLYYATYDGEEDYIPDLFYGRISVDSKVQLQSVLEKVLEYEQYKFPDPSFLDESVLIAGVDGTFASRHGNGQINYAHDYYFNEIQGNGAHTFLYPASDTSDNRILDLISGGVGFVNYTGHGLYDRWINPTFHQNDIENLQNRGKYPVMIGNGCETNVFNLGECFAEALLRAEGKGALAYIGCTNDSYWDEDYYWAVGVGPIVSQPQFESSSPGYYDRVFHTHGEPYSTWAPSLGEMIFGGNMAVQQSNSPRKKFYWEIYQLAGDPTIIPWFSQPYPREVHHPGVLPTGSVRMDLTCAPFDYVALSQNGMLLDAVHASDQGHATLHFPHAITEGTLDLVVSGHKFMPYIYEVLVGVPSGPYLDLEGYDLSDESVEKDGLISLNEQFSLQMQWINRGASNVDKDTLVLFASQEGINLLDSLVILEKAEAGDTIMLKNAFRIGSGIQLKDQEPVRLGMYWKGDPEGRRIYLQEKIYAPLLISGGITWDDRPSGNGNGIAEPGEWLDCNWSIYNMGHYQTGELIGDEILKPGDSTILGFTFQVTGSENGPMVAGPFSAGDQQVTLLDSFTLYTGRHFEDFTGGKTDNYPFNSTPASPWRSDSETYTTPRYSLRSGKVPNYGVSECTISFETIEVDTLSFAYRVSSEDGYDFLNFYVDSILMNRWSGERGWDHYSMILEPGFHRVTWAYQKDQLISSGKDAAWIDDVIFPTSAFSSSDLSLIRILQPLSGPWLTNQEQVTLLIRNSGKDTIVGSIAKVEVDQQSVFRDTVFTQLLPGEEIEFRVSETFDFSEIGIYRLQATIETAPDEYQGNNQLEMELNHYVYPDLGMRMVQLEEIEGIRTDAVLALGNEGNIRIDSLRFEIWIDDILTQSGIRFIGLEPGEVVHNIFTLVDSTDRQVTTGDHDFLLKSTTLDSISTNNEVSGVLFWHSLDSSLGLMLYPNPASDGFTLLLPRSANHAMKVEIVNIQGGVVATHRIEKGSTYLFISADRLAPGNYLLYVSGLKSTLPFVISE